MIIENPENPLFILELLAMVLLGIASLVGIVTRRLQLPYTLGLVLVGLVLSLFGPVSIKIGPEIVLRPGALEITPDLILGILVPPLIYEAAFHLNFQELRRNLDMILVFSIIGVILTTFMVGGVVAWLTQISLATAIVFGALVAATDPIAVLALFRSIGVPKRLQVILEGESLFNDGTAIVVYTLALDVVLTGHFDMLDSLVAFVQVSGGGLIVGLMFGWLISQIVSHVNDPLIETTLTLVLAYGAYLIAEGFHVSGVLAVVAAGLVSGNIGPRGMAPSTRILVFNFWEIAAFLANSIVFLLIGLEIDISVLILDWQFILVAILGVLIARAVVIYGLSWIRGNLPFNWLHVLYWGGLRGAISLALALSIPLTLRPDRDELEAMAFGVVLFTLLVQGITMEPLIRRMGLIQRSEQQVRHKTRHARVVAGRAAYDRVNRMHEEGLISDHTWNMLSEVLRDHVQSLIEAASSVLQANPEVETDELDTARTEALLAQRSALTSLLNDGIISDDIYTKLLTEVDNALADQQSSWTNLIHPGSVDQPPVNRLIAAVVQSQDAQKAAEGLARLGIATTRLPSQGAFLGRRNITLLIGLAEGQEEVAVKSLQESCRRRVEFVSSPLAGLPIPLPRSKRISVGGATLFVFEVVDFIQF